LLLTFLVFLSCKPLSLGLLLLLAKVKLREEEREAAAQHQQLVQMFDELLTTTVFAEKMAIVADVERFHTEKLPPQVRLG